MTNIRNLVAISKYNMDLEVIKLSKTEFFFLKEVRSAHNRMK